MVGIKRSKIPSFFFRIGALPTATITEDAQLCVVLRPGMLYRAMMNITNDMPVDKTQFLCVCNMDWAVLGWPLLERPDGSIQLDGDGRLHWHFVFDLGQFEAALAEPILGCDSTICVKPVLPDEWQPALVLMIRHFSMDLVFRQLVLLARDGLGILNPSSFTRKELLRKIALECTQGDSKFADAVVENEEKSRHR